MIVSNLKFTQICCFLIEYDFEMVKYMQWSY